MRPVPPTEAAASHAQRALWTLQRIRPSLDVFNVGYAASADGSLDPAVLADAVAALVDRHEILRTTYRMAGQGELLQVVHPTLDTPIAWHHPGAVDDEELLNLLIADSRQPVDLERGPILRVAVYVRPTGEHVVLFCAHHISTDLLSYRLLMEELEERYRGLANGHDVAGRAARQFRAHVEWHNRMLSAEDGRRHETYWRQRLSGNAGPLAMPTDRPRPPVELQQGSSRLFELPPDLVARLDATGRACGASLHSVLLAGFVVLLHRYSGQPAVTIGSYVSGRIGRDRESIAGLISNPVPVLAEGLADLRFDELVRDVAQSMRGAIRHQFYPLALMAERLQPSRDASRSPIFQAVFNLDRQAATGPVPATWRHEPWLPLVLRSQEGQFELKLMSCVRHDGSLLSALQYQTSLYDEASAVGLVRAYRTLLEDAAVEPARAIGELRLLDEDQKQAVLQRWNDTARPYALHRGVHELVRDQARRSPDRVAVCHGDDVVTYRELSRRSAGLARRLSDEGVGRGSLVAVSTQPGIGQVIALLAVLEAGAAYLPLDPSHPGVRRQSMIDDADAMLLIGDESGLRGLRAPRLLALETLSPWPEADTPPPTVAATGDTHRAYVLYTSGSSGSPKGVEISHTSLVNLLLGMQELVAIRPDDTFLSITTLSFDIAALEIFLPLLFGARLVVAERDVAGSGRRLVDEISRHGATMVQATPTSWRLFAAANSSRTSPLTKLCGGEPLTRALADQLLADPGPLWNVYGPTETTIWSTASLVTPGASRPTIGRPLANTQVYVLDRAMRPVPPGVIGELWIGGDGVALGYVRRPELTAERFVPDPFSPGEAARLYRTGDLARWLAGGELEFLGRFDDQIKVRGIRIEPAEIEAALGRHPQIAEAVVVARAHAGGESSLAAYVVAEAGAQPDLAALRLQLREHLPDYMIPSSITRLDALPLTANRKVDRRALPEPAPESMRRAPFAVPRSPIEQELARLMCEVLGLQQVGLDDDFFDIGGASIASLELAERAEQSGLRFAPEAVFEHSTVRRLAALLAATHGYVAGLGSGPS